jgi:hypothetical protein
MSKKRLKIDIEYGRLAHRLHRLHRLNTDEYYFIGGISLAPETVARHNKSIYFILICKIRVIRVAVILLILNIGFYSRQFRPGRGRVSYFY